MNPKTTPECVSTDESLDDERQKTDEALARKRATVQEDADEVVRAARKRADAVLLAAREVADHPNRPVSGESVKEERARDDAAVVSERALEDKVLDRERLVRRRALAELFTSEREQTDLHLFTERKRSDEGLNTRDTFLAMVSHDLRSMLNGVAMTASLLARDDTADTRAKVQARAQTIGRLAARMNKLVADLIDVATIETGRPLVVPERRDVLRLVEEAEEGALPLAAAHGIVFTAKIIDRPALAHFDHDRVLQVLANLITNAIKFTPAGGHIDLRAEALEGMVQFSVKDTGCGIATDKLEAVFERFWQVGENDRRGLGLGLYISKCIVEGHGGRIWAESIVGKGTTMFFTLPQREKGGLE